MPSIITHDAFGTEVYEALYAHIGGSRDESQAFLLGNQGPDPLFYAHIDPLLKRAHGLGSRLHREKTAELLVALRRAASALPEADRSIGRAWALGFLCHYLLDRTVHPLVYHYEHAICDAGIEGLDRQDHSEVHAVIESELDELVLTVKLGTTARDYNPGKNILRANERVLGVVSGMCAAIALDLFDWDIPKSAFAASVKHMRFVQAHVFHSAHGRRRTLFGEIEAKTRRHSFVRAMSPRAVELEVSAFDNHEHAEWESPVTGKRSTASFWELFDEAKRLAFDAILAFDAPSFDLAAARALTRELNFAGEPARATIVKVEG